MTRALIGAVLPIGLLFSAPGALGQERCLAAHYRLPANIAEDLRPYLLCGLVHERSDTGVLVNGVRVWMHGQGPEVCGNVRTNALHAAERHLLTTVPDAVARGTYLNAEFKKADEFLLTAKNLDDLGVVEEPKVPACRSPNAQH